MTDIHHRIGVESSSTDDVYAALTTIDGLSGWWTTDTQGDPGLGGKILFRFPQGGFDMEVIELTPGELVRWRVTDGPSSGSARPSTGASPATTGSRSCVSPTKAGPSPSSSSPTAAPSGRCSCSASRRWSRREPDRPPRTMSGSATGTELVARHAAVLVWSSESVVLHRPLGVGLGLVGAPGAGLHGEELSAIPDTRLVVYRGAGHSPNWEDPARVARDIESFLRSTVAQADAS